MQQQYQCIAHSFKFVYAILITEDGGAVCSEEVLDSQNVTTSFVPKFSQSGSKGDQDHSDQQQPPKVCDKYSWTRAYCGYVFQHCIVCMLTGQ